MSRPQPGISLSQTDTALFVRIDGPATMTLGPAFTAVCDHCREEFNRPMLVDLSACERIDSTFAGCLVSQWRKARESGGSGFALVHPSPKCIEALAQMSLDRLLTIEAILPPGPEAFTPVADETFSAERVVETVIEAHEQLAGVSEANARVFGPIAAAFKTDLERKRQGDA